MIKFYSSLLLCCFLTACSTLPQPLQLPQQTPPNRLFKVEQLDQQNQLQQTSLLSLQTTPKQWRWVQTDALGSPLSRVLLSKQGWQNDGFIMPNRQAQWLYSALASAFNPTQPLFALSSDISAENTRCYKQHNNFLWCTQSLPGYWLIQLADSSHWRITELTENSNKP